VYISYRETTFLETKFMAKVLENALRVLESVAEDPETPRALSIIAAGAGLNPATCSHILKTLAENGYVEQAARKAGYTLGPNAYRLSARGPYRKDLVRRAEPGMLDLSRRLGESVLLSVLRFGRRVTLREVESGAPVTVHSELLREADPWVSATGRVLIAGLDASDLEDLLRIAGRPGSRWPEAASATGLAESLADIRRKGYAVVEGREVTGLAFPIREKNRTVAALGSFVPQFRFVSPHREAVTEALRKAAAAASTAESAGLRAGGVQS
jgi:DNA-binding IclR family transcriptional regulator